jgi:hypothetical protein
MASARSTVVSIGTRADYHPDFNAIAAQNLKAARERRGEDRQSYAATLSALVGWEVTETTLAKWERGSSMPPGDILLAATAEQGSLIAPPGTLLGLVPHSFPASALDGLWVTSYQFTHNGQPQHHADIAHVTAESDQHLSITTGAARTEGRGVPFRNEIEARLLSRHVVGHWKNTSDARYFGSLQLAVLPGETVMEGWYTGFASDIAVSCARWRWVRLGADPAATVALAEPAAVHETVMGRSEYDGPLTIADIGGT